ncbi:MAG: AraC family transcriptional regulator [Methylococcales bacterium]
MKSKRWSIRANDLSLHFDWAKGCLCQSLPESAGKGQSNIFHLDQGLTYIETKYSPEKDLAILSTMDDQEAHFVVTLAISGCSRFVHKSNEDIIFDQGYTTITAFSSSVGVRQYKENQLLTQLRFSLSQKWFDRYFGEQTSSELLSKSGIQMLYYKPISPEGMMAAKLLLNRNVPREMRHVFMHGQAMSILATELNHICEEDLRREKRFNKQDMEIAYEAHEILSREFRIPPSVDELAKRSGTNQFKLKQLFHCFFDNTPYGVLLEIRMNNAYKLLQSTHCHVSVAAYHVGYNHASNFSAAFTRFFGVSPKHIARK